MHTHAHAQTHTRKHIHAHTHTSTHAPVAMSHTWAEESYSTMAASRPPLENATSLTRDPCWAGQLATCLPVSASHSAVLRSLLPVMTCEHVDACGREVVRVWAQCTCMRAHAQSNNTTCLAGGAVLPLPQSSACPPVHVDVGTQGHLHTCAPVRVCACVRAWSCVCGCTYACV